MSLVNVSLKFWSLNMDYMHIFLLKKCESTGPRTKKCTALLVSACAQFIKYYSNIGCHLNQSCTESLVFLNQIMFPIVIAIVLQ